MQDVLKVGDKVERVMVVAKKVRRSFTGGKFLLFQFSDRDGILGGVFWDPGADVIKDIHVHDVVKVKGEVQEYQGTLQLKVIAIERLNEKDYDPVQFLQVSGRSSEILFDEILKTIASINDEHLRSLLQVIFEDTGFRENFCRAPAAKGWHHSYVGGLAEHVHDMLRLALRSAEVYPEVDRDLLLAGVLLHDLGKLQELSVTRHIDYSDMGRLLGHISLGVEFLDEYLRGMDDFPEETGIRLKHMILSHHGSLENGSPIVPMTVEALLLHYIDNLDAQVRGTLQMLEKDNSSGGRWTEYVKLLNRFIYRGVEHVFVPHGEEEVREDG